MEARTAEGRPRTGWWHGWSWRLVLIGGIPFAAVAGCGEETTAPDTGAPFRLEEAYTFPPLGPDDFIVGFDFDGQGALWLATYRGVVHRVADGAVTRYDTAAVFEGGGLRDLFIDPQGRPWVAVGGSVAVFDEGRWADAGPPDLMGLAPIGWEVAVNEAGDVLVAMGHVDAGGLLLRRDGEWTALTPANSPLPSPIVGAIEVGPDGSFWIGSTMFQGRGGLSRLDGGEIVAVYDVDDPGLLYNWIDALAFGDDRFWLGYAVLIADTEGGDGGIQALDLGGSGLETWYPASSELVSNRVNALAYTSSGELWFTAMIDTHPTGCVTCFGGIGVLYPDGRIDALSYLNSDLPANVYAPEIREGPDGSVYVATAVEGDRIAVLEVVR